MKILAVMDSFKGSMTADTACRAVQRGALSAVPDAEVRRIPFADGGEGTVSALIGFCGGHIEYCTVSDISGNRKSSYYGVTDNGTTAVIETAAASGLPKMCDARPDPLAASSTGTGELIVNALDSGFQKLIVCLGGSGMNDGGMGAMQALGAVFYENGGTICGKGGRYLEKVVRIDTSRIDCRAKSAEMTIVTDVRSPLCGKEGATLMFGPQKGVCGELLGRLENGMKNYAAAVCECTGTNCSDSPGAGAAGGLGFSLMSFFGAKAVSGAEFMKERCRLEENVMWADLVITGEGKTDAQTMMGKAPSIILDTVKKYGKRVIVISGSIENCRELDVAGFDGIFPISDGSLTLAYSIEHAEELLERRTYEIVSRLRDRM